MTKDIFEAVPVNQEQFEKHVDSTFEKMGEILKEKNRMYGGASMDTGLPGNYIRLHDKMNRYKTLLNNKFSGKDSSFEGIEDTLRDIIGYATIGLAILDAQEKVKKGKEYAEHVTFGYTDEDKIEDAMESRR